MKNTKPELTKQDIMQIVHFGIAEHSPLAQRFISEVKSQFGFEVVACYLDTYQTLKFDENSSQKSHSKISTFINKIKGKATEKNNPDTAYLENCLKLTVYFKNILADKECFENKYGVHLLELFKSIASEMGICFEYPRVLSQWELKHYGFLDKNKNEWDMSKLICPQGEVTTQEDFIAESFNTLVLSHMLYSKEKSINKLKSVENICAKVHYGWNPTNKMPTFYIVLPDYHFEALTSENKKSAISEILNFLHSIDKEGVVNDKEFSPIFMRESDVSDELRFAFSRGW